MNQFGKWISLLLLPLIAIIVYSALSSFFFKAPPSWTFEVSIFIFGSFFMLGAAYCHGVKGHVAVDIVSHYLPAKWQTCLGIFSELTVFFVVLVLICVSVPNAWQSTLMGERSILQTPFNPYVWWFRWIIPISAALIAWQALKNIRALLRNKPGSSHASDN